MNAFLSRFSTGKKLAIGFGVLIFLLCAIGGYGMLSAQRLGRLLNDMYAQRVAAIGMVDEANFLAVKHNRTIYSLAAEQDAGVIDDILREMGEYERDMKARLAEYAKLELSAKERELLARINGNWPQYTEKVGGIADVARAGNTGSALTLTQGSVQNVFRLVDDDLSEIVKLNKERAREADLQGQGIARRIFVVTSAAMAIALVVGGLLALAVTRNIAGPLHVAVDELKRLAGGDMTSHIRAEGDDEAATMLRSLAEVQAGLSALVAQVQDTATQLRASVHQVSASSESMAARAGESSHAVRAAAATLSELAASIDSVGTSADEASARAAEAGSAAQAGRARGDAASGDVARAADRVGETADMIQQLSAQMVQVGAIANVIKDIADQTNLLALNAAIEAARAGEQGRGFAVVADEVRKLAERTTASAQEITRTIVAIQDGTEAVVSSMEDSRRTMNSVRQQVSETTQAVGHIEASTASAVSAVAAISATLREQRERSGGIAARVDEVARLSEENVATIEAVSRAMAGVRQVTDELARVTGRFKVRG